MSSILIIPRASTEYGSGWAPATIRARGFFPGWSNFDTNTQQDIAFTAIGNRVLFGGRAKKSSNNTPGSENVVNIPNGFDSLLTMGGTVGWIDAAFALQLCNFGILDNGANLHALGIYKQTAGSIFVADFNGSYQSNARCSGVFEISISNDRIVMLTPKDFNYYTPTKVCFYHHGFGDDVISHLSSPQGSTSDLMRGTINAMLDDGWAVAAINGGSIVQNWGNPGSAIASNDAIAKIRGSMTVSKIACIGQSMGGLSSLRMAQSQYVSRWYGIYPVCNLDYAYAQPGFTSSINTAYNGASGVAANKPQCNPLEFPTNVFDGKQLRSIASSGDTLVSKSQNSDLLLSRFGAGVVTVDTHTGNHGDLTAFNPAAIVNHLNS